MNNLSRKILAEQEYIETSLKNLRETFSRKNKTIVELAAAATFLHNIYNGIENIIKQIIYSKKLSIKKNETWHKDLLELSVTEGILSKKLSDKLY